MRKDRLYHVWRLQDTLCIYNGVIDLAFTECLWFLMLCMQWVLASAYVLLMLGPNPPFYRRKFILYDCEYVMLMLGARRRKTYG
jgi:hypothetical protein